MTGKDGDSFIMATTLREVPEGVQSIGGIYRWIKYYV